MAYLLHYLEMSSNLQQRKSMNTHFLIYLPLDLWLHFSDKLLYEINTSNHMFGRAIWDKLPECVFESFQIAQVKRGQLENFQKLQG